MKFGYQGAFLANEPMAFTNNLELSYRVNNGVPNQLTQTLDSVRAHSTHVEYDALYAQEQWTRGRMTLQGALRYDHAWSYYPGAAGRRHAVPADAARVSGRPTASTGYNDLTPRARRRLRRVRQRQDVAQGERRQVPRSRARRSASTRPPNPVTRIATDGQPRAWTDANGNFVPDCDLLNPALQDLRARGGDFCAALSNQNFGKAVFSNTIDPAILSGRGVRGADWQIGASVQQEVLPRVSVEVGYYRRWLQNFLVTDNLSVAAVDFDPFSVTAPSDPRLPGGGGYVVSNLYNVTPTKFGQTNNYVTFAGNFGEQYQRYNGLMINVSARPRDGLTVQGGVNTGKTVTDNCAIRAQLPEIGADQPVLPQRAGTGHTRQRAGGVHDSPDRRARQRHVPQRSGPGRWRPTTPCPAPGRAVARPAGGRQRGQRDGQPARARRRLGRSRQRARPAHRQDPAVRPDADQRRPRYLQRVQLERGPELQPDVRPRRVVAQTDAGDDLAVREGQRDGRLSKEKKVEVQSAK